MDPAWKTPEIVGRAVATMVESREATKPQQARLRKTTRIFRKGRRLVWSVSSTSRIAVSLPSSETCCRGTSAGLGGIIVSAVMFICEEIAVGDSALIAT